MQQQQHSRKQNHHSKASTHCSALHTTQQRARNVFSYVALFVENLHEQACAEPRACYASMNVPEASQQKLHHHHHHHNQEMTSSVYYNHVEAVVNGRWGAFPHAGDEENDSNLLTESRSTLGHFGLYTRQHFLPRFDSLIASSSKPPPRRLPACQAVCLSFPSGAHW